MKTGIMAAAGAALLAAGLGLHAARAHRERAAYAAAQAYAEKCGREDIAAVEGLLNPVSAAVGELAAKAAAQPARMRAEQSREDLHDILVKLPQLDGVVASFEDGYHRVVTHVDDHRRAFDSKMPAATLWHSSFIEACRPGAGRNRVRHRTMYSEWPTVIKTYDFPTNFDMRESANYREMKRTTAPYVSDPLINLDTGGPILSIGAPIVRDGRFIGVAVGNITFGSFARFLDEHKPSPNSIAMIVDADGSVIVHPDLQKCVRKAGGQLIFANLSGFADEAVRDAAAARGSARQSRVVYRSGQPPAEYLATFTPFPESFGKKWEVLTVAPASDFLKGPAQ